jgi:hypothetical protein
MKLDDNGMRMDRRLLDPIKAMLENVGATEEAALVKLGPGNRPGRILVATDRGVARLTVTYEDPDQIVVEGPLLPWRQAGVTVIVAGRLYSGQPSAHIRSRIHISEGEGVTFERPEDDARAFDDFAVIAARELARP